MIRFRLLCEFRLAKRKPYILEWQAIIWQCMCCFSLNICSYQSVSSVPLKAIGFQLCTGFFSEVMFYVDISPSVINQSSSYLDLCTLSSKTFHVFLTISAVCGKLAENRDDRCLENCPSKIKECKLIAKKLQLFIQKCYNFVI